VATVLQHGEQQDQSCALVLDMTILCRELIHLTLTSIVLYFFHICVVSLSVYPALCLELIFSKVSALRNEM